MSDTPDTPDAVEWPFKGDPNDRSDVYAPPSSILFPEVAGRVRYALVTEGGVLVGVVWAAIDRQTVPRAGILLNPAVDPSVLFQNDLGYLTLTLRSNSEFDAVEFIDVLTEDRDGLPGTLMVGGEATASSLDALRRSLAAGPVEDDR